MTTAPAKYARCDETYETEQGLVGVKVVVVCLGLAGGDSSFALFLRAEKLMGASR